MKQGGFILENSNICLRSGGGMCYDNSEIVKKKPEVVIMIAFVHGNGSRYDRELCDR